MADIVVTAIRPQDRRVGRAVAQLSRLLRDRVAAGDLRAYLAKANRRRKPDPRIGGTPRQRHSTARRDRPLPLSRPCVDDPRGVLPTGFVCRRDGPSLRYIERRSHEQREQLRSEDASMADEESV